jgi:hypothetical protein
MRADELKDRDPRGKSEADNQTIVATPNAETQRSAFTDWALRMPMSHHSCLPDFWRAAHEIVARPNADFLRLRRCQPMDRQQVERTCRPGTILDCIAAVVRYTTP